MHYILTTLTFLSLPSAYVYYWDHPDTLVRATAVLVATALVEALIRLLFLRPVPTKHMSLLGMVVFFGSLTVYLNEGVYIQWKTTILNLVFAGILVGLGRYKQGKYFKAVLLIPMPQQAIPLLSGMIGAGLAMVAVANTAMIYLATEEQWLFAKTLIFPAWNFAWILASVFFVSRKYASFREALLNPTPEPDSGD